MHSDADTIGKIVLAIYCLAGLPVVWLHMRQYKLQEPYDQIQHPKVQQLVIYTLAVMWPLLLLSMTASYLLERNRRSKAPVVPNETPGKSLSPSESEA